MPRKKLADNNKTNPVNVDVRKYIDNIEHRTGSSCLYLSRLSGIDMGTLKKIVIAGVKQMRKKYPTE
jgi:hypothetical protein